MSERAVIDLFFDEPSDDPDAAAALFERVAPDLPAPRVVRREPSLDPRIPIWTVEASGLAVRMKTAAKGPGADDVRRGAALLVALRARGALVPESLRVVEVPGPSPTTVALERRLGTGSAVRGWAILGTPGRVELATALAGSLVALHEREPVEARIPWRAVVEARAHEAVRALARLGALSPDREPYLLDVLAPYVADLPESIVPALCHQRLTLVSVALQRRTFAGLTDFEHACPGDPWADVSAALIALGDPPLPGELDGGPIGPCAAGRRLLLDYVGRRPAPPRIAGRLFLYSALMSLESLGTMAETMPEEAGIFLDSMLDAWTARRPSSPASSGSAQSTGPRRDAPPG